MLISPVSGMGGGGVDPILKKRYAALNRELRKKRLKEKGEVDPLDLVLQPKVKSNESVLSVEELREINSNPLWKRTPIKIAYRFLQRLCDEKSQLPQNIEYFKKIGLQIYKNQ